MVGWWPLENLNAERNRQTMPSVIFTKCTTCPGKVDPRDLREGQCLPCRNEERSRKYNGTGSLFERQALAIRDIGREYAAQASKAQALRLLGAKEASAAPKAPRKRPVQTCFAQLTFRKVGG
jgi:hypothetical protein